MFPHSQTASWIASTPAQEFPSRFNRGGIEHVQNRRRRVVGHCVLLCGVGCCLWTRGFSGRRGPAVGPGCLVCPWPARGPPAPQPGRGSSDARRTGGGGVLHYTKPSGGVSPACRSLMSCNSPRLVALQAWCWLAWRPQCRPPQQTPVTTNCYRRGRPRCGHNSACRGVLLAGEHIIPSTHPIYRMVTG